MIQATFTLSIEDFNEAPIERIKIFLQGQNVVVTIQVNPSNVLEAKKKYWKDLDESIAQLDKEGDLGTAKK